MNEYIKRPVPADYKSRNLVSSLRERDKLTERWLKDPSSFLSKKLKEENERKLKEYVRKEEEKKARLQWLQEQRKAADEIREQKRKKQAEADAQVRKEKAAQEALKKKLAAQQQADEDAEFERYWNSTYLPKVAPAFDVTGQVVKLGMHNATTPSLKELARQVWNFNNYFGQLNNNRYVGQMDAATGRISEADLKQTFADAKEKDNELLRNINAIKEQRAIYSERLNTPLSPENKGIIFSPEHQQYINELKQSISECDKQIKQLEEQRNDPEHKQMVEEYKLSYIKDHGGTMDMLWEDVKALPANLWASTSKEKDAVNENTRQKKLAKYDEYIKKNSQNNQTENFKSLTPEQRAANLQNTVISSMYIKDPAKYVEMQSRVNDAEELKKYRAELEGIKQNQIKERTDAAVSLDKSRRYWNVAESFKKGEQIYQDTSLFDWRYWKYVSGGLIGSSNSSPEQIKSNLIQGGTTALAIGSSFIPVVGALAPEAISIAGNVAAAPSMVEGSKDENYVEWSDKEMNFMKYGLIQGEYFADHPGDSQKVLEDLRNQSVKHYRDAGLSEKWIKEQYFSGTEEDINNTIKDLISGITKSNHQEVQKLLLNSKKGSQVQFDANNIRTITEGWFQLMMNMYPLRGMRATGQFIKGTKAGEAVTSAVTGAGSKLSTKAGRVVSSMFGNKAGQKAAATTEKYANGFNRATNSIKRKMSSAYNVGELVGEAFGFGFFGKHAIGAASAATGAAVHLGGRALSKVGGESVVRAVRNLTDDLMFKYQAIYDKLLPKDWMRIAFAYGMNTTRRGILQGMSEGAEEGVQYLNSKEDFAGRYGFGSASLGDLIVNDFTQGGRIKDAYLSLFGIGNSPLDTDQEFWQNVKGGFALGGMGGFHPGQVMNVYGNVRNAVRQYTTNEMIARSAVLNRTLDQKDRASNTLFAKLAMANREIEVSNRMKQLYEQDRRRENPELTQEDYDEKMRAAASVMSMTKNKQIRGMLEAKGIKYGTTEYATAIADIYNLQAQQIQNEHESKGVSARLELLYSSKEFKQEVANVADKIKQDVGFGLQVSRARVEAGEKAVKEAIERAKKDGVDTSTPEFAIELQRIRKDAQTAAENEINDRLDQVITHRSQLVNKLKGLLHFKAQQNSAEDFFSLLSNKLNLRTMRPDSKTILNSTIKQIEQVKKQLSELDPSLNLGKTDEDLLKALESMQDVVTQNSDEIQQQELNGIILNADRAVTDWYMNQFRHGIVKNKEGKYEYNPKQYKAEQDKLRRYAQAILSGNKEEAEKINAEDVTQQYDESEVEGNEYKTRVANIIATNAENAALDWMVADAYAGDLVSKYADQVKAEYEAAQQAQEQQPTEAQNKPIVDPVTGNETTAPESSETRAKRRRANRRANLTRNREVYERRKAKAKAIYNKAKKSLRKNAYSSIIPAAPQLAQAAAYLMQKAAIGTYKIAELVQDLKDIVDDIDIDTILPTIKEIYSKYAAKAALLNPAILNNFSTPEEIQQYMFQNIASDVTVDTYSIIQETLRNDQKSVIEPISTHFYTAVETENGIVLCQNTEAINHRNSKLVTTVNKIKQELDEVVGSKEEFKQRLTELSSRYTGFPVDEYVKYREVEGITDAIANHLVFFEPTESVVNGIKARNAVLGVLLGKDYLLDDIEDFRGKDDFVRDMQHIKSLLEKAGYKIIDVNQTLFDANTKKAVQADIICVNEDGKVHVIDVLSSYASVKLRYNNRPGEKAEYTIKQREEEMLHLVETILHDKFNTQVNSLCVLPITCDAKRIEVQKTRGKIDWLFVDPALIKKSKEAAQIEQLEQSTKSQVAAINDLIAEYNNTLTENKLSGKKIDSYEWTDQPAIDSYTDYSNKLQDEYESIQQRLADVQAEIQQKLDEDLSGIIESAPFIEDEIPEGVLEDIDILSETCRELDAALNNMPEIRATTEEEKAAVRKIWQCVFDAQRALNAVLVNEDSNQIDVSAEQELIASAMERLAENVNFSKSQKFVQKWWLDNIVLNTSKSNTEFVAKNSSQQYVAFFNTMDNWINTLYGHVMTDLENSPKLQDWYDTLLNVYFAKLLDNAQDFINKSGVEENLKKAFNEKIKEGREMLLDFNGQFSMRPDKVYPEAPKDAAEKLNRISQKYADLYVESTAHSPAFDAMLYSDPYYFMSQHEDFADKATVTFEIAKRTKRVGNRRNKFGYDIHEGDVIMVVQYKNPDGTYNFAELPLVTSEGYKPSNDPEVIDRIRKINNVNKKFEKIVKQALEIVKNDPNKKLAYTTGVHRGKIKYGRRSDRHNVSEFIFRGRGNEQSLYTIQISKDCNLGIAAFTVNNRTGEIGYGVYAGNQLKTMIGSFDDLYKKNKLKINNGALIYFYDTGGGDRIGTPIENSEIGTADATKLVNLMQKYVLGERMENGYNIYDLLSMRLYMADPTKNISDINNVNNLVTLNDDGIVTVGNTSYDVMTNKEALVSAVSALRNVVNAKILNENMATSENNIFSSARQFFRSAKTDRIELPNGVVLTKDDFTHKNEDGSMGSTWLGHMLRNNMLYTTATGKSYKQIYVDGFKVVNKNDENIESTDKLAAETKKQKEERRRQGMNKFDNMLKGLKGQLRYTSTKPVYETEDAKLTRQMQEYLYKTLGKDDSIFKPSNASYLAKLGNEYVLGYCTSKAIEICAAAPMSVAYHEAFHRVFELLIPDNVRDSIYETYKQRNPNLKTNRDVAENLADRFVLFMDKTEGYRDAHGLRAVVKFYKYAAQYFGLASALGFKQAYNMLNVYLNMNAGKYANAAISDEKIQRFENLFGDKLTYTVYSKSGKSGEFKYLANSSDVHDMVKSLSYWIAKSIPLDRFSAKQVKIKTSKDLIDTLPSGLIDMLCGNDLSESELDNINLAFREVFHGEKIQYTNEEGVPVGFKMVYPNMDILLDRVNDYLESTITRFTEESDTFSDEEIDAETEEAMSKNIEQYDKAAFESSKIDALPDNVKFFFSTIPYLIKTKDGIQLDLSKNKFGPEFMPINQVYKDLFTHLYKCESIEELDKTLQSMSSKKPLYAYVYDKFHALYENCYFVDENGNDITNYNAEAYCINLLSALRGQNIDFIVATSKAQDGGKEVQVKSSSLDRDKYTLAKQWYTILTSGQVSVFNRGRDKNNNLVFKEGMGGTNGQDVFSRTAQFIQNLVSGVSTATGAITINDVEYNIHDIDDLNDIKNLFVDSLNNIGIIMSRDALDDMLQSEYVGDDAESFTQLLTNKGVDNVQSFIDKLNNIVSDSGVLYEDNIKKAYCECGFVSNLAANTSRYRRNHLESMTLGLNGKKLYPVSQNNTVSFIVNQLNTRDSENPTIRTLMKYGYNLMEDGPFSQGSIILEHILNNKQFDIHMATYIGSRTDNRNDVGSEYKEEPIVDDYMAKLSMLLSGMLIFPTLADKGTWHVLSGIPIPGMSFAKVSENGVSKTIVKNMPSFIFKDGKAFIRPANDVLDRMIAYANTERLAIQQCMENLGYDKIPGYKKEGRKVLTDAEKIKNLHTPNGSVEPNGTRFLSLTEIAVLDENGKVKLDKNGNIVTLNLNDPRKSSAKMLELANRNFFNKKRGETDEQFINRQRDIMAYTLNAQYQLEVQCAVDLGIIERTTVSKYDAATKKDNVLFDANDESMFNLDSKYLNVEQVEALSQEILRTIPAWSKLPAGRDRTVALQCCKSLAIASILSDATTRSIISSNEVLRCFTGNPALFKVSYEGDHIKDSTFDLLKRLGGIVSTGDDNAKLVPGIPRAYTCAECKDYEVSSKSDIHPRLKQMFVDSSIRDAWATLMDARTDGESWSEAFDKPVSKLLADERLTDEDKAVLEKAKERGEKYSSAYDEGINVADGQAYITEQMCENLLRQRGALTDNVKKAFDILRGDDKYSWQEKSDAYKAIYDAVNIVTTKYTAYGFRDHTVNGEDVSDVAVAYYNKYSLAPLFSCLATGKMRDIYQKMNDEGVDMLLMTSAVKVGSQGAVKYNGDIIDQPFNKYEQDYSYLRRQLNTDPEEGDTSTLGTQMVKIVLQNLRLKRDNYVDSVTGERIGGQEILDNLMGSINELAEIAAEKVRKEFGLRADGSIDNKKLSNFLRNQLSSRNANKALLEAVSLDKNGNFKCPIDATSNAKWIESILISVIAKRIADVVTPGNSFVQRSVFAMEGSSVSKNKIQSDKDLAPEINGGKKLQMINEDDSMDAVISIDYFESILPKGLSFNEARQWLIDNGIIGQTGSGVKSNTIGYRIPTQAQSSIHALRFVDVVPAVKCTIILPEEFTKITGSDFDIDHLYLASLNYALDEVGNIARGAELSREKQLQNDILNNMMTLLKDTENSMHSLYKSIDNDTELLTNPAKLFPEIASSKSRAYNFGTLHEQVYRRTDYVTGKFGIGPFALNVTNQVLTRLYGVKFASTQFTESVGLSNLGRLMDMDNNYIDSWLSAFINAHVDIVKDPYISKMNVNKFTYNMVNLLVRAGFGESAVWFVAQPIIAGMANASSSANSQFMATRGHGVYSRQKEAIANAVKKFVDPAKITPAYMEEFLNFKNKKSVQKAIDCVQFLKDHKNVLEHITTNSTNLKPTDKVYENMTLSDAQEVVFLAWKALEKYATAMGQLVQCTKIDTKKQGKSLLAIHDYYIKYNNLVNPTDPRKSLFDMESLKHFCNDSWINSKTEHICKLPFSILGKQMFEANRTYVDLISTVYRDLNPAAKQLNVADLEKISTAVKSQLKAEYIAEYAKQFLGKTDQDITNLFVGNRCMAYRLNMLNAAIRQRPEYKRLANNALIQQLYSLEDSNEVWANGKMNKKPSFISIADTVGDNQSSTDVFIDAWEDLLNDDDKFVRAFARDLIVYAYMTSGESSGWNSLFKYVPPAWVRGEIDNYQSLAGFVRDRLQSEDFNKYLNLDVIAANNYRDMTFCKPLYQKDSNGNNNIQYNSNDGLLVLSPVDDAVEASKYLVYKNRRGYEQNVHDVYKLETFVRTPDGKTMPVYVRIKTKGFSGRGSQKVLEYGWNFNYAENERSQSNDYADFGAKLDTWLNTEYDERYFSSLPSLIRAVNMVSEIERPVATQTVEAQEKKNLGYESMSEIIMNSGGAHGADTAWDFYARKAGVVTIQHFRDQANTVLAKHLNDRGVKATVLTKEQMDSARTQIYNLLGIRYNDDIKGNLQARNYYQVANSDAVFAVATVNSRNSVTGGTNTAVQLAIKMLKPLHVFDVDTLKWYLYNQESKSFEVEDTPVLTKNFAGVGTRDIENYQVLKDGRWENRPQYVGDEKARAALSAIKSVFDKTQAELNKNREQIENSNELTLSEEELKKAEEIKNHCKGGK